jgi:hypothetical protein
MYLFIKRNSCDKTSLQIARSKIIISIITFFTKFKTRTMNNIEDFSISLPITTADRNTAQRFASQQPSPQAAERVRRNTLSILVMCNYLEMMGIDTNLEASDSWHPVVRLCTDVADLEIVGVGKLECRSLQAGESTCYMPPEVWEGRIGYTLLRLEEDGRSATILGFVKKVSTEYLALDRLEPIENLCEAIELLRKGLKPVSIPDPILPEPPDIVIAITDLGKWLQGIFDAGWQELETLLVNPQPKFARRGDIVRWKEIDLSAYLPNCRVALVVTRSRGPEKIRLEVSPVTGECLPQFLKLVVLDKTGKVFQEIESRSIDKRIQFKFNGEVGERFSAQVVFAELVVTENLVI